MKEFATRKNNNVEMMYYMHVSDIHTDMCIYFRVAKMNWTLIEELG